MKNKIPFDQLSGFHEEKRRRTKYYYRFVYKWKLRKCGACNGSGYYDDNGSPKCSACNGTRVEKYCERKDIR